jgi:hypothetical protein
MTPPSGSVAGQPIPSLGDLRLLADAQERGRVYRKLRPTQGGRVQVFDSWAPSGQVTHRAARLQVRRWLILGAPASTQPFAMRPWLLTKTGEAVLATYRHMLEREPQRSTMDGA